MQPPVNTQKKSYFKRVFGGKSAPTDPNKARYQSDLKVVTAKVKRAGKASKPYKSAMAELLKKAQAEAKAKDYAGAVKTLGQLSVVADRALATGAGPQIQSGAKGEALGKMAAALTRAHSEAVANQLITRNQALEDEYQAIGKLIEQGDDTTAGPRVLAYERAVKRTREAAVLDARLTELYHKARGEGILPQDRLTTTYKAISAVIAREQVDQARTQLTAFNQEINDARKNAKLTRRNDRINTICDTRFTQEIAPKYQNQPALNLTQPDPLFTTYTQALAAFESDKTMVKAEAAANAARAYLDYLKTLQPNDATAGERPQQKTHCEKTLKDLGPAALRAEYNTIPTPYDEAGEARAGELYAKILLDEGGGQMQPLGKGTGGVNTAFWLERDSGGGAKNKFIFKNVEGEEKLHGFPQGGSACREVLGKCLSDKLGAIMNLDFGVAETHLVSIDSDKLPVKSRPKHGGPAVGSLQHNVHHKGEPVPEQLGNMNNVRDVIKNLPKSEVEKVAVLDLISLNCDRHQGNLMVQGTGDQTKVLPIDHGLTFPSPMGFAARRSRLGANHALLNSDAMQEKFSQEIIDHLEHLDEDALANEMKASFDVMKQQHPTGATDAMFGDENVNMTKRSVQFLKAAARELTMAEIFNAYLVNSDDIFNSPDDQRDAAFARAIAETRERTEATKEMKKIGINALFRRLDDNNWWAKQMGAGAFVAWASFYPKQLKHAYDEELDGPLAGFPQVDTGDGTPAVNVDPAVQRAYDAEFGPGQMSKGDLKNFQDYQGLGGLKKFLQLGGCLDFGGLMSAISIRLRTLRCLIAVDQALRALPV